MPTQPPSLADLTTFASAEFAENKGIDITRLSVLSGPGEDCSGRMIVLGNEALVLGRSTDPGHTLGLNDRKISRQHCAIEPTQDGWSLRDLDSTHGTWLGDQRITQAPLVERSVVRIGDSLLLFERLRFRATAALLSERAPLWGPSFALHRLRGEIAQVAAQPLPVLVLGETGTGKELVARALHEESGRAGPFIPINCGALPANLIERELFGNTRGAFTGADRARPGLFEEAEGGTLFLDEVGDLSLDLQPKLLRVLAEGEVRAVGAARARAVDVRIVAATNRDLSDAQSFRPDLLARLQGWVVRTTPLRERPADILSLGQRFAGSQRIDADAAQALVMHGWALNVRELKAAVEQACLRAGGATIRSDHLPESVRAPTTDFTQTGTVPIELRVRSQGTPTEHDLRQVLEFYGGTITETAAFFGKDRKQIYRWMDRYGISRGGG